MAATAFLDLLRKNPNFGSQGFSSRSLFAPKTYGTSAAFAVASPFAFNSLFRDGVLNVAYCDVGVPPADETLGEEYFSRIKSASANIFQNDALNHSTKEYYFQLKPLFSAFYWKSFAMTSIRSFLLYYLPLIQPEDDEDFLEEQSEKKHVDLVAPFHKSVKQIVRETSVITTRRVLERVAVHYVSQRMAWKLLKDVPQSAVRKAGRGLPTTTYIFCVSRSTLRGHFLGVLATWTVQVSIEVYRFVKSLWNSDKKMVYASENIGFLAKKVHDNTLKCASSLVFASIGAGIGATLFRPSTGQWIGCAAGDLSGPIILAYVFEKVLHQEL